MYREADRSDEMVAEYARLIESEPDELAWRSGLARHYLERGDRPEAEALWRPYLAVTDSGTRLLWSVQALVELGLDDLAIEGAEKAIALDRERDAALLALYRLHRARGRLPEAQASLDRLDALAPAKAAVRIELAEAYEQLGLHRRSVEVIEHLREARGAEGMAEDLEMRLAWLYSEIGDEEKAIDTWYALWRQVKSVPRRRYVEDRLMTVASRLGTLADVAIELEEKLVAGTADDRDCGLLVRLYVRVGDAVSAAEVIDEYLEATGGTEVEATKEKSRVYLECNDYYNYEVAIRRLIEIDPEGEGDYYRQLAMSQLERGRPDEAREVLEQLKGMEIDSIAAEFEAGVLALAGMRREAIVSYRRGLATHPDRIESYLLMADLMRATGAQRRAVGMFQFLAENAEKDDLFTIAIDGLLNLEASPTVLQWARRITLERLTTRPGSQLPLSAPR